tara:strand:+ start:254 stop:619 length:366 start_codon:yes stop_codon:yes gene_type:complete
MRSYEYEKLIKSDKWKLRRKIMIQNTGGGCEKCFLITTKLEIHHKHYNTLGNESDQDLEVLCEACHRTADRLREYNVREKRYSSQVDGWAIKVYGEDWEQWKSVTEIEEEFREWLYFRENQ